MASVYTPYCVGQCSVSYSLPLFSSLCQQTRLDFWEIHWCSALGYFNMWCLHSELALKGKSATSFMLAVIVWLQRDHKRQRAAIGGLSASSTIM